MWVTTVVIYQMQCNGFIYVKSSPVVLDLSCCNDFLFVFTLQLDHSMSKRFWQQIAMTITPKEINEHVFNVELKANRFNTPLSQLCMKETYVISQKWSFSHILAFLCIIAFHRVKIRYFFKAVLYLHIGFQLLSDKTEEKKCRQQQWMHHCASVRMFRS